MSHYDCNAAQSRDAYKMSHDRCPHWYGSICQQTLLLDITFSLLPGNKKNLNWGRDSLQSLLGLRKHSGGYSVLEHYLEHYYIKIKTYYRSLQDWGWALVFSLQGKNGLNPNPHQFHYNNPSCYQHMLKTSSGVNLHPRELHLPFLQWDSIQWNATSVSWLQGDVDIFCTDSNHSCCIFDKLHPSLLQNSIKLMIQWAPAGCMGGDFEAINGDSKGKHSAKCQLWWLRCHNITSGGRPK